MIDRLPLTGDETVLDAGCGPGGAGGARRAGRGTTAAAGADIGIDRDMIACRRDRTGRAEVETARAAGNARPRMGAEIGGEIDVARLVELTDEVGGALDERQ